MQCSLHYLCDNLLLLVYEIIIVLSLNECPLR